VRSEKGEVRSEKGAASLKRWTRKKWGEFVMESDG
jgi:hypothetical protein